MSTAICFLRSGEKETSQCVFEPQFPLAFDSTMCSLKEKFNIPASEKISLQVRLENSVDLIDVTSDNLNILEANNLTLIVKRDHTINEAIDCESDKLPVIETTITPSNISQSLPPNDTTAETVPSHSEQNSSAGSDEIPNDFTVPGNASTADLPPELIYGISLSYLEVFIQDHGGREQLSGWKTGDICIKIIEKQTKATRIPWTQYMIDQGMAKYVQKATFFISHAWDTLFLEVVDSILYYFECNPSKPNVEPILWFSVFSVFQDDDDQHFSWWNDTFTSAIKSMGNLLFILVPWDDPLAYTRAWCVFEVYACQRTRSTFNVAMTRQQRQDFLERTETCIIEFMKALANIQSSKSTAFKQKDADNIHRAITEKSSFSDLDRIVFWAFEKWIFKTVEQQRDTSSDVLHEIRWDNVSALLYKYLGRYEEAKKLYENNYERIKIERGERHIDTLRVMGNLASFRRAQGDNESALKLYLDCLNLHVQTGSEYPMEMLTLLNDVGSIFEVQGKYCEAEILAKFCLDMRNFRLNSSQDYLEKVTLLNNLAMTFESQGKYNSAESLYEMSLDTMANELKLGAEHPRVINISNNLASLYIAQGNYAKAEKLYNNCLQSLTRTLGPEHPSTITCLNNVGLLRNTQGAFEKAEEILRKCWELRKKVIGDDHSETQATLNNLALACLSQGKYNEAEAILLSGVDFFTKHLGEESPDTVKAMNNLAFLYDSQGNYKKAEEIYEKCLAINRRTLGENHPATLTSINNLATVHQSQGNVSNLEQQYLVCLQFRRNVLGNKHPDTLVSINNLAVHYQNSGDFDKAEELLSECMNELSLSLGDDHPSTLISRNNLAGVYKAQGKNELAEDLYISCLASRRRVLGEKHTQTLTTLNNLAVFYESVGNFEKAEQQYENLLNICRSDGGLEPEIVFMVAITLFELYKGQCKIEKAEKLCLSELRSAISMYGAQHPCTSIICNNLCELYVAQGLDDQAVVMKFRENLDKKSFHDLFS